MATNRNDDDVPGNLDENALWRKRSISPVFLYGGGLLAVMVFMAVIASVLGMAYSRSAAAEFNPNPHFQIVRNCTVVALLDIAVMVYYWYKVRN